MGSVLPPGSVIHVVFEPNPKVHIGDLVYFRKGEQRIVHRFWIRIGPWFIEKGDTSRFARVRRFKELLGKVVAISPQ